MSDIAAFCTHAVQLKALIAACHLSLRDLSNESRVPLLFLESEHMYAFVQVAFLDNSVALLGMKLLLEPYCCH